MNLLLTKNLDVNGVERSVTQAGQGDRLEPLARAIGAETKLEEDTIVKYSKDIMYKLGIVAKPWNSTINRRKLNLIKCGEDAALVIPGIQVVMIELNDYTWDKLINGELRHPAVSVCNQECIRRIADLMMTLDFGDNIKFSRDREAMLQKGNGNLWRKRCDLKPRGAAVRYSSIIRAVATVLRKDNVAQEVLTREVLHDCIVTAVTEIVVPNLRRPDLFSSFYAHRILIGGFDALPRTGKDGERTATYCSGRLSLLTSKYLLGFAALIRLYRSCERP